jgi:chromosomal replication initiator protein
VKEIAFQVGARPLAMPSSLPQVATVAVKVEPVVNECGLNARYTFANFIVGKGNELAQAAAKAVAERPGVAYNPLFFYGGVGLGKTHLVQAIGNEIRKKHPEKKVLYVTCETFTNEFIDAVRSGRGKQFHDIYRGVDVLLIDDIQFISGKTETQEAFFHTFNDLYHANKQIVISSDRHPKAIPTLENRLISRFEAGMITDIAPPDFETRTAILSAKCQEKHYSLPQEIIHLLAAHVQHNVRELEGALNKIIAFHQLKNIPPTLEFVKTLLASTQPVPRKNFTPKQLVQLVASFYDLRIEDLLGKSREKRLAYPRQIIMYLLRVESRASFPAIGHELGDRDHTTAMHACEKINRDIENDPRVKHEIDLIKERLYAG